LNNSRVPGKLEDPGETHTHTKLDLM
jgi:hypothetical protein